MTKLEELKERYFKFGFPGTILLVNEDTIINLLNLSRDLITICEAYRRVCKNIIHEEFNSQEQMLGRIDLAAQQIYEEKIWCDRSRYF